MSGDSRSPLWHAAVTRYVHTCSYLGKLFFFSQGPISGHCMLNAYIGQPFHEGVDFVHWYDMPSKTEDIGLGGQSP